MKRSLHYHRMDRRRRGALMPAIAFALLVIGAATALVLNTLWIDAVEVELQNVAEAAALAAAGEYLGDPLLNPETDLDLQVELARNKAARVALENRVAGEPVRLNLSEDEQGDVFFGRYLQSPETGNSLFVQTNVNPDVVEVRAGRLRSQGNPILLFFPGLTNQQTAETQATAEAVFDNVIDHFRPSQALPVPAFPMAILADDPLGVRTDTWDVCIEQRAGSDEYRFDPVTHHVLNESDGIPEITLKSVPLNASALESNVQMLEFASNLDEERLAEQIRVGLRAEDLTMLQGILPAQIVFDTAATANVTTPLQLAMESQIGQQRLCLLYHQAEELSTPSLATVLCQGVVAIRILKIIPEGNEAASIIVQPTVLTTRTAALARFQPAEAATGEFPDEQDSRAWQPNRYVYKLFLNR